MPVQKEVAWFTALHPDDFAVCCCCCCDNKTSNFQWVLWVRYDVSIVGKCHETTEYRFWILVSDRSTRFVLKVRICYMVRVRVLIWMLFWVYKYIFSYTKRNGVLYLNLDVDFLNENDQMNFSSCRDASISLVEFYRDFVLRWLTSFWHACIFPFLSGLLLIHRRIHLSSQVS